MRMAIFSGLAVITNGSRRQRRRRPTRQWSSRHCCVTAMSFQRPVFVGDEVSCYAKILKVGRTSITVQVEAFARRGRSGEQIQVTEGVFTYVAVDSESKPRPV